MAIDSFAFTNHMVIRCNWSLPGSSGYASKCKWPPTNTGTAECGEPNPMLGLPQCIRGPNRSIVLYTCEKTSRRRQTTGWKFSSRPTLPDDYPRIWLGRSAENFHPVVWWWLCVLSHMLRAVGGFSPGMNRDISSTWRTLYQRRNSGIWCTTPHDWDRASVIGKGITKGTRDFIKAWNYLHMCQSIHTRSRPQSSTPLLAATKARAPPNQLNYFNVSAEIHTWQLVNAVLGWN